MPKGIRSRRIRRNMEQTETQDVNAGGTYAGLDYHAHCVVCGMMANIRRFPEAPYEVDTWIHYFGGSVRQQWDPLPEAREDALRLMLSRIDDARAYLRSELGVEDEPEEEEIDDEPDDDFDEEEEDEEEREPLFPDDQIDFDDLG